ncbi:cytochrome P450 [Nocardia rhamnosiphila]
MTVTTEMSGIPDLADPETFKAGVPHEVHDTLRSLPGLAWQPAATGTPTGGFWLVTRYSDVAEVFQNPDRFSSRFGSVFPLPNLSGDGPMSKLIVFTDPPDHSRIRRAAAKSFGPRVVANFESWIHDVVVETLDDALPLENFDWVNEISRFVPSRVIAQVLGVPIEQRDYIVEATNAIFKAQTLNDNGVSLGTEFMQVGDFMMRLGETKLANPADDMTTVMAQALDKGDIDIAEYQLYTASMFSAGFETTHTTISHIGHMLATDSSVRDITARALDEGKSAELVDEFIRYITPAMRFARVATRDTTLGGQHIKKDEAIVVVLSAANRDPDVFSRPNEFDPFREGPSPAAGTGASGMAFGAGPHRCIGHMLAKLELRILLEELHRRKVNITMNGQAERGASGVVNQLLTLPVSVTVG